MSFLSRAAALAALTLSLAGLAQSAPGIAAELDRTSVAAAISPSSTGPDAGSMTADAAPATRTAPVLTPAVATDTDIVVPSATSSETASPKFESLDAAIAAQDMAAVDEDLRCLASAIFYESHGEPMAGQLAVAQVIINRAKSGRFPPDICGVITQRGQFSFVRGGVIPAIDTGRTGYRTALAVAKVALTRAWQGEAANALFFHARQAALGGRFIRVAAIGNHIFYR